MAGRAGAGPGPGLVWTDTTGLGCHGHGPRFCPPARVLGNLPADERAKGISYEIRDVLQSAVAVAYFGRPVGR